MFFKYFSPIDPLNILNIFCIKEKKLIAWIDDLQLSARIKFKL